jgi:hypothetical protein
MIIGSSLAHYTIVRKLGSGGMGEVYWLMTIKQAFPNGHVAFYGDRRSRTATTGR